MENNQNHQEFVESKLIPLHRLRQAVADDKAHKKAILDACNNEHAAEWDGMTFREEALARMEADVRTEALRLYQTIPNASKTFLPGVTIRDTKVYSYEPDNALEWAKHTGIALQLDAAAYKKQLLAGSGAPGQVYTEPVAAIAQDLGPVLLKAQP